METLPTVDRVSEDDLELVDPHTLEPHPDNPREHDDATIRQSIRDHGLIDVIVAQRSRRRILGGHGRWENGVAEGATRVPVLWVDCDDDEAEEIMLVLNRAADEATYHDQRLADVLGRIRESGRSTDRAGWSTEATTRLLSDLSTALRERHDAIPATERHNQFAESEIRQIVLILGIEDFERATRTLATARGVMRVESNSEVVLGLIDAWAAKNITE